MAVTDNARVEIGCRLVAAYVRRNPLPARDLDRLISSVGVALRSLSDAQAAPAPLPPITIAPAKSRRRANAGRKVSTSRARA